MSWLDSNVREYVKICDPYFVLSNRNFLQNIPEHCQVMVVTTDKGIPIDSNSDDIQRYWHANITPRQMPQSIFFVVPNTLEQRFHVRVILTKGGGLDVGPSINGLGRSHQKIYVLDEREAQDYENTYVRQMLEPTQWLIKAKHVPSSIVVDG